MNFRRSEPTHLTTLIKKEFKNPLFSIMQNWHSIVGDIVFKVAIPIRYKNSSLLIGVTTHPWMQELALNKHIILKRIHELTSEIKEIRFAIKSDLEFFKETEKNSSPKMERKKISTDLMQYIIDTTGTIEDSELREIVYNTMYDAMTLEDCGTEQ